MLICHCCDTDSGNCLSSEVIDNLLKLLERGFCEVGIVRFYQEKGQLVDMEPDVIIRTIASFFLVLVRGMNCFRRQIGMRKWRQKELFKS